MSLYDIDFSRRLPIDFHKTVTIPLFPKIPETRHTKPIRGDSLSIFTKSKSNLTNSNFKKVQHSESKFSAWNEIRLPFSKTLYPRSYHSAVFYQDCIYVYGGYELNKGILFDFQKLNYSKRELELEWESLPLTGVSPGKLYRHNACIYKNRMYVFGGKRNVSVNNDDIYFYDFEIELWFKIYIDPKSIKPKKIDSFSLSLDVKNEKIIIFGGYYGKFTNSLFYFHLNDNRWEKIISNGIKPSQRAGHCAALYQDTYLYVSGGGDFHNKFNDLWCFDLSNLTWSEIYTNEHIHQPGIGHTMQIFEDSLIIFGGIENVIHERNDLVLYDLKNKRWKKISFDIEEDFDTFDNKQSSLKPLKKNTSKNALSYLPRSNTKAINITLNNSLANGKKRSSTQHILSELAGLKNSFDPDEMEKNKNKSITFHENINKEKPLKKNEMKTRSPKSLDRSKILNNSNSSMQKTIRDPTMEKIKLEETKKRILLDKFEIFDEKLKKEFLHITPTTEIMKSTIAIFFHRNHDDSESKKQKILTLGTTSELRRRKENKIKINGNVPCPRDGHTALIINNKMIIIGGDRHQRQYHDIYECDVKQLLS